MSTLHQSLIDFRNALGYKYSDCGVCVLYANMAINAFLIGELKTFHQRCAYIKKKMEESAFLELIKKVRASSLSEVAKSGSTEELKELPDLMDAMAFIDSGDLFQYTHHYDAFFGKRLKQFQTTVISPFAQSRELELRGGRALAKSFTGIYTFEELKDYIKLLNRLAQNAQQDFALNLGSDNHGIGLCYSHATKSWQLIDANQPNSSPVSTDCLNCEKRLAMQIKKAFGDTTHILFQTDIWTTGIAASGFQNHINTFCDDSKFKQLHDIASHAALTNTRGVALVHRLSQSADVQTLSLLGAATK